MKFPTCHSEMRDDGVIEYDMASAVRDDWIRSLRPGQIGWIARLSLLAEPKRLSGPRPSRDFAVAIAAVMRRVGLGARIIEGDTGVTSDDEKAFADAIGRAADRVASDRRLTPAKARKIGERPRTELEDEAASRIDKLEIALNRIVGHGNITVEEVKKIAADALQLDD